MPFLCRFFKMFYLFFFILKVVKVSVKGNLLIDFLSYFLKNKKCYWKKTMKFRFQLEVMKILAMINIKVNFSSFIIFSDLFRCELIFLFFNADWNKK